MIQPVIRRVPPIGVKGPMMDFIQCCSFNIDFAMAIVYNEPQNKMMPISSKKRLMFFSFYNLLLFVGRLVVLYR